MKLFRKATVLVILLGLMLLSSGCGSRTSQTPIPGQTNEETPTPSTPVPPTTNVAVYYLKGTDKESYLVREVHQVEKTQAVAQAAVNELIKGNPVTPGAYRILSPETKVWGINIDQGQATVNFSSEVLRSFGGSSGEALGIASIVNTLTEFPNIQKVSFMVDGQVEKAIDWWGHVGLSEQPFSRDLTVVSTENKEKGLSFILQYGILARNQIDTFNGTYTKDLISAGTKTIKLRLNDTELSEIEEQMKQICILDYPEKFVPENNRYVTPNVTYHLKIKIDGATKEIHWEDYNCYDIDGIAKRDEPVEATQLRNVMKNIITIIEQKEAYKKLPQPVGGYD